MTRACAAAVLAALMLLAPLAAAAAEEPGAQEALVLLRILSYDRRVPRRGRQRVVIAVVRDDRDPSSTRAARAAAGALRRVSASLSVAGRPISVMDVTLDDMVRGRLRDVDLTALYLAPGLDASLDALAAAARSRACLTFAAGSAYLGRGVAIGLGIDARRHRITISVDLVEARAQGAQLSAELLQLARVVRR
jgi:hypothetical protein